MSDKSRCITINIRRAGFDSPITNFVDIIDHVVKDMLYHERIVVSAIKFAKPGSLESALVKVKNQSTRGERRPISLDRSTKFCTRLCFLFILDESVAYLKCNLVGLVNLAWMAWTHGQYEEKQVKQKCPTYYPRTFAFAIAIASSSFDGFSVTVRPI